MSPVRASLPHLGDNRLFLADLREQLVQYGIHEPVLLRASEAEKLERVLTYGSDRGGYPGDRRWRYDASIPHAQVILATTPAQNRDLDHDPRRSTSLKKFPGIESPLLLAYAAAGLERLRDNHYRFVDPRPEGALSCLRAVFEVPKLELPEGWFSPAEGHHYRALAQRALAGEHARGRLVELGCWLGRSTSYLAGLCRARAVELLCVDHWAGSSDDFDAAYRARLEQRPVEAEFRAHLERLQLDAQILRQDSRDAAASLAEDSVDLVFLDASHDRAAVEADIRAWRPKLRLGGLLAGHDYAPDHPGVVEAVDAAADALGLTLDRGPGSLWCLR